MKRRAARVSRLGIVILAALLAACEKAEQAPTPTPHQENIAAASTLFAQPTQPPRITPTPTPLDEAELEISRTVAQMEQAVLSGDADAYLATVWPDDAAFYREQAGWAQDWQTHPLRRFEISLSGLDTVDPDTATARTTILWSRSDATGDGTAGGTTISAVFRRQRDRWLFAGEQWETLETDGFRLRYFGNSFEDEQAQAAALADDLPAVYTRITREFGTTPEQTAEIKLYPNPAMLQTMTRMSTPLLGQWNAPGEAIKLTLGPLGDPPETSEIAREYTRFALFELAGDAPNALPWWFEQGVSEYGASLFRTLSQRNRVLERVAGLAGSGGGQALFGWDALATNPALEAAPQQQLAIDQAYTLIRYITDTHGADVRNAWLRAIAAGQTPDDATQEHLGLSLADLDGAWRAWLPEQVS